MTIPDKLKETTDLFGLPLKIGDACMVFESHEPGYTGIKDTSALHGVVTDIEVFPTTTARVRVEHYTLSNNARLDYENTPWMDEKKTRDYYNTSVLGMTAFREAVPEYFL